MKLFVAASSKERHFAHFVMNALKKLGHECHDWTQNPGYEDPSLVDHAEISRDNLGAVAEADGLIWMANAAHSTGAPFEAGFALGLGVPVVVMPGIQVPGENIYGLEFDVVGRIEECIEKIEDLIRSRNYNGWEQKDRYM